MARKLYRKEAIEYKKLHWKGKALLLAGMPAWLIVTLSSCFLIALISTLIPMYIHPTYRCTGEVITLPHSVNVFAPQQGFVLNQYVKVGDIVKKVKNYMK